MKIDVITSKVANLVLGKIYILQISSRGYYSLGVYIGRDIRGYFYFYNVMKLKVDLSDNLNYVTQGYSIDIGSEEVLGYYKQIIEYSLKDYQASNLVIMQNISDKVYNEIDMGIDTRKFIEQYGKGTKPKLVGLKSLNKQDLYVSTSLDYCLKVKRVTRGNVSVFEFSRYAFRKAFWRNGEIIQDNKIWNSIITYNSLPKLVEVHDLFTDKQLCELFKQTNPRLYEYCLKYVRNEN